MKRRRVNVMGIRTATKVQVKEITRRAKQLEKNPELVIPECKHSSICPFEKVRREIQRIREIKDDEGKLKKMAAKGTQLARAYAAFVSVGKSGKITYLAAANMPTGVITYVMRSKIKKEVQIGVQHFDDPGLRMLAVKDLVKKFKVWVFSTNKKMVCTGRDCSPPNEFVPDILNSLKYRYKKSGNAYHCQDLGPQDMRQDKLPGMTHLLMDWQEAGIGIAICERCAGKEKNILGAITERVARHNFSDNISVKPRLGFECRAKCDHCESNVEAEDKLLQEYKSRMISDRELLSRYKISALQEFDCFALGELCFGKDMLAFIESMEPTHEEKAALAYILEKTGPTAFAANTTPNKILAEHWDEHGLGLLEEASGNHDIAVEVHKGVEDGNYYQAIIEAKNRVKESEILASLPEFEGLSKLAAFADAVGKTYKGRGREETLALLQRTQPKDTKMKTFKFAFLAALDEAKGIEWKFTNTERDFGSFLMEYAQQLLNCDPDNYTETLKSMLSASGNDEELTLIQWKRC